MTALGFLRTQARVIRLAVAAGHLTPAEADRWRDELCRPTWIGRLMDL